MSRIAFFCIPAWGHTNPTVEVVRTLVRQGHQVRYYSFAPFREKLEDAGAEVVLCDGFLPSPPKDLDKKVGKDFSALVEMAADTTLALEDKVCRELTEFRTEVIVSDSVCFWGKLFAWKLGIPYICSTTTFAFNQHTTSFRMTMTRIRSSIPPGNSSQWRRPSPNGILLWDRRCRKYPQERKRSALWCMFSWARWSGESLPFTAAAWRHWAVWMWM